MNILLINWLKIFLRHSLEITPKSVICIENKLINCPSNIFKTDPAPKRLENITLHSKPTIQCKHQKPLSFGEIVLPCKPKTKVMKILPLQHRTKNNSPKSCIIISKIQSFIRYIFFKSWIFSRSLFSSSFSLSAFLRNFWTCSDRRPISSSLPLAAFYGQSLSLVSTPC